MKSKAVNNCGRAFQRSLSRLLSTCVYGILFCVSVGALDRDRSITQFHHTAWTAKEGAPGQIRAFAQTGDGYLWLGSSAGLYRFDGIQFDHFTPRSGGGFPSNNIYSLLAAPEDGLWIGYWYGGVSFLKDGNLTNYGEQEGLPPGRINSFAKDEEGTIWAAASGGLARFEGSRWQRVGPEWNYPGKSAQAVFVDKTGTLWVAAEETIMFLPKGTRSFQPTGEKLGPVNQMAQSPDGAIWMAETTRAVRQLQLPGNASKLSGPEIQVGSMTILFDRNGALWVPSVGDGIRRVPYTDRFLGQKIAQFSTNAEIFTEENGLSGNYIFKVFEDREGNIWTGTANGLDRFRNSAVVPVRFPPGEIGFGLAAGDDGEVWTVSRNLWMMRGRDTVPNRTRKNDGGSRVVFRDKAGTLWISGGFDFIWGLRADGSLKFEIPVPVKDSTIIQIFKDHDDRLSVYFETAGLFQLKDGVWTGYERQTELPKSAPIAVTIDSLNRKWIGYPGNLLTVIDGDRIRTFSGNDGLRVGDVKAIYEREGRVWAAGTLGAAVFDEDRFRMLAAEKAEALTDVSGIVEARDGSLWLNASRGIINVPTDEVRRFLANPTYSVRYRVFDFLDGLPGPGQRHGPFPTAVEGSDGLLWFSTTKGVVWIDPQQIPRSIAPPPVSIRSLTADEKLYELLPSLELPEGTANLQVDFTALSLSIPERIHFRYKLVGVDDGWQEAGTRRQAFYNSLAPGIYQFRVIASNHDGVWNETGATLDFVIKPMFYQTLWFRLLIFLLALLLIGVFLLLLYRWRLARATRRLNIGFEERLAERTRIAHELHDTLLQGFFGAAMRLQGVSNLLPAKTEKAKEDLDDVLDQIDVVLEEGRRAIWDMQALSIGENDLGQAFTLAGEDLSKTYPANFSLTIEGERRPLHPLVRDQIYRIGREALTNSFRHSQAAKIELEIEYAPKYLRVLVRDDGCGISPDYLSAGREGHLGLSGMRDYAVKTGAELKIWSRAESGTEVELIVPQQVAFEKRSSDGLLKRVSRLYRRQEREREK